MLGEHFVRRLTSAPSRLAREAAHSYRMSPSDSMTDETQIEYFYAYKVVPVRLRCVHAWSQVEHAPGAAESLGLVGVLAGACGGGASVTVVLKEWLDLSFGDFLCGFSPTTLALSFARCRS